MSAFAPPVALPLTTKLRLPPLRRRRGRSRARPPLPVPTTFPIPPNTTPVTTTPHATQRMHLDKPDTNWPALSASAQQTLAVLRTRPPAAFIPALRRKVAQDPANPFLWNALAKHVATTEADLSAAVAILAEAVAAVPPGRRGGLYEAWGSLEQRRGRLLRSIDIFAEGLYTDPFAPLYVSLGAAQVRAGLVEPARLTFRAGSRRFPAHASLWRAWAHLESRHGPPSTARQLWRTAVEKDRVNPRAWRMLVSAEQACNVNSSDLIHILHKAVAACPNDVALRLTLSHIELKRKNYAQARAALKPVEYRDSSEVLRLLAHIDAEQGNVERSRVYYRKAADMEAVKHSSRDEKGRRFPAVKALHAWALMETREGNINAARKVLEEAKGVADDDSGVWRAVAELESRQGNFDQARSAFRNALAIDPNDVRILLAWGKTELLAGDLEKAEMLIDRVTNAELTSSNPTSTVEPRSATGSYSDVDNRTQTNFSPKRGATLTPHVLADALRERAMLASRNGEFEASVSLLTRASQLEPAYPTGWRLLAQHEMRLNGAESARKVYKTAMEHVGASSKAQLLHWWGQDERASGSFERARLLFRKATCANPDYMSAWISWGLMEKSLGNVDQACSIFQQASHRAEQDLIRAPFIFQAWGRVEELDRGKPDVAADIFQRGVKLAPKSGPLWCSWGLLEERRGNVERARDLFGKATDVEPRCGSAWHSWALLEARRCNFERAGQLYRQGNENDPSNAALLVSWALMVGKELSDLGRGRDLFEQAIAADPYYSPAFHSWGCLEMSSGAIDRAKELFNKAVELRPEDPSALHSLGILEAEKCGNNTAAVGHWQRAIKCRPGHALSYQAWALLEGKSNNNMEEARRLFQVAIDFPKQKPSNVALLLQSWANLEEKKDNVEEARTLLRKSLAIDRRRMETWRALAMIEKTRGRRDDAKALLRDGIEDVFPASTGAGLYVLWASIEAEEGDMKRARELFASAIRSNPSDCSSWDTYASVEQKYGSASRAAEISLTAGTMLTLKQDANENFLV